MKLKDLFKAVKIAGLVGKSIATGKVAKTLDKITDAVQIAEAVRNLLKNNKQ